jgi:hypothetical protein
VGAAVDEEAFALLAERGFASAAVASAIVVVRGIHGTI